ncbi:MAG: NUDIX domain-containing protein, partial [Saccharofermentans sp.]|nr:NUDIX domain-containing protein [Saccharofermentans sp.]
RELLEGKDGYQTPKVETRAMIFNGKEEVLLVRDHDGLWNPPGGWCEYNCSIFDNTVKEALEETGHKVRPYRLAGVFDHRKDNNPKSMFSAAKFFVLCEDLGGEFKANIETTEIGYYALDNLPEINTHKANMKQLELCLEAYKAETWETYFD